LDGSQRIIIDDQDCRGHWKTQLLGSIEAVRETGTQIPDKFGATLSEIARLGRGKRLFQQPSGWHQEDKRELTVKLWIGTSGWYYKHWGGGVFYPKGLSSREWLSYYGRHFRTVELNNSFYRLPPPGNFEGWRQKVPEGFLFAVKGSRFITHVKKLVDVEEPLRRFLANASALGEKRGPLLFQFPPSWVPDLRRLEDFFRLLSERGRASSLKVSIEVRNQSALTFPFFDLLSKYEVSLCLADWDGLRIEAPLTASRFIFLRRHGPLGRTGGYSDADLRADADRIAAWLSQEREVFIYFNNDIGGWAIRNAQTLFDLLSRASSSAA
jgi:uncharacterized protein YecE (DUF72 family)